MLEIIFVLIIIHNMHIIVSNFNLIIIIINCMFEQHFIDNTLYKIHK